MYVITFKEPGGVKHGRFHFLQHVSYGFEDPDAAPYFIAAGWADEAPAGTSPAQVISIDEIDIDPETIFRTGPNDGKRLQEVING
jgi:hypothetical protein